MRQTTPLPSLLSLLAAAALFVVAQPAAAVQYAAPLEQAHWTAQGSTLYCELSHHIPYFGVAKFYREAGGEMRFALHLDRPRPPTVQQARLLSVPPAWKHEADVLELGALQPAAQGRELFAAETATALRLVYELEKGMFPTVLYEDGGEFKQPVSVAVSAVNFRPALEEFWRCNHDLLSYNFDAVATTVLMFDKNGTELNDAGRAGLDQVLEYLSHDPAVRRVRIFGHADDVGRPEHNEQLSLRRAEVVRDYLRAGGAGNIEIETRGQAFEPWPYWRRRPPPQQPKPEERRAVVTLVR